MALLGGDCVALSPAQQVELHFHVRRELAQLPLEVTLRPVPLGRHVTHPDGVDPRARQVVIVRGRW